MEERMPKERTTRSGSVIGINAAAAQCASDPISPETPISQSESFMECSEPLTVRSCLTLQVNSNHCQIIPFSLHHGHLGCFRVPPSSPNYFCFWNSEYNLSFSLHTIKTEHIAGKRFSFLLHL